MTYGHERMALKTSLRKDQIIQVNLRSKSIDFEEDETVAYDPAMALLDGKGHLAQSLWETATRVLGKELLLGLIHYTSLYVMVCDGLHTSECGGRSSTRGRKGLCLRRTLAGSAFLGDVSLRICTEIYGLLDLCHTFASALILYHCLFAPAPLQYTSLASMPGLRGATTYEWPGN